MTDEFSSWIGKSVTRQDLVTQRLVDEYCATLAPYLFEPAHKDECPPGFHWCVALPTHDTSALGPDGAEAKGTFLPPVPLPRRMWAGGQVATFKPMRVGDHVTRVSTITDIKQRQGKSGSLCFISVTHDLISEDKLAIRERHDILYRDAAKAKDARPEAGTSPDAELRWQIEATPLLLFRFSAVTFNGHRIHYDLSYAKTVEGYDGLLVHGPMQAALTMNQLSVLRGSVPKTFVYRCVSPLIAGQNFIVQSWRNKEFNAIANIANATGIFTIEAEARE